MSEGRGTRPPRRARGVTLVEQVMVLAVIAALVTIGLPSLAGLLARNRAAAAQMDVMAGLRHARALAVTRQLPVIFCPTRDGARCEATSRWDSGWLVGEDRDVDGQPDRGALLVHLTPSPDTLVRSGQGRYRVRFRPDGSAPGSNLTLTICGRDGHPQHAVRVVVSNAGRVRGAPVASGGESACRGG